MSPRSEEFMAMALNRLTGARASLAAGSAPSAISAAYYAMLNAARAALSEEDLYAKTHRGTWDLFRQTFVETVRFDAELLTRVRRTQPDREAADYAAVIAATSKGEEIVALAERFIAAVRELVGD